MYKKFGNNLQNFHTNNRFVPYSKTIGLNQTAEYDSIVF